MKEDTAHCIANCLATNRGSHVFYRGFGLDVIDSTNAPIRRGVLVQLSTYYPDVALNDITITRVENDGHFEYKVDTKGI